MAEQPTFEELVQLGRRLAAMPRRTREVFLAHRIDDYDYPTIAAITGLSVKQVERHMAEAIAQLAGDDRPRSGLRRFVAGLFQ